MAWWKRKQTSPSGIELDADRELEDIRERRRNRFRILVCIDGSDESYEGVRFANDIGQGDECDIILLYVRQIDQGLRSGGLQMRVARENMLEWDLELPGIQYLKRGRDMLIGEGRLADEWQAISSHTDIRGDPLGDNKIEYRNDRGKGIVLKLKTAPDTASGILDQYELGPYNVMIIGTPSRREASNIDSRSWVCHCSGLTEVSEPRGPGPMSLLPESAQIKWGLDWSPISKLPVLVGANPRCPLGERKRRLRLGMSFVSMATPPMFASPRPALKSRRAPRFRTRRHTVGRRVRRVLRGCHWAAGGGSRT